jgi:hypothetical protein
MTPIRQFLKRIVEAGAKRPGEAETVAMGKSRTFHAYDIGESTFIFEQGIDKSLGERPSILIVDKRALGRREGGKVMTVTSGNHSVAAFPLLDGRLWKISRLPREKRSEVLKTKVICANAVGGLLELSQREVSTRLMVEADAWLMTKAGFQLDEVVMGERNDVTLEHYRRLGQEWRVKPLAWTEEEMKCALAAAKKRISSKISYYHSMKGVHFLSFPEFKRFSLLAQTDAEEFLRSLKELVGVDEAEGCSFMRMHKHRGHHEIEFFGLTRGVAHERLVPELEKLLESIERGCIGHLGVIQRVQEIAQLYESLLTRPGYADECSPDFVESLYMHITGEIYSVAGEISTPAFDDRRPALPGATFVDGCAVLHPGIDTRTEILISNIQGVLSKDEIVEYANVYELRTDGDCRLGEGPTREIVYKTNRGPLEHALVEKRLSREGQGYGSYMLARVEAFKALGMGLSEYRILRRRGMRNSRPLDYYIRRRCEGEPMETIPANYYCRTDDSSREERDVVLAMASLMGDAAAQNMAMKKYDPRTDSPLYGVGKEIYEFDYDIARQRIMPARVSTCSVRGSFGWHRLDYSDENLNELGRFYLAHYAAALRDFASRHEVALPELAERFMDGFEYRTHAMAWQLSVMRDKFEAFLPNLPGKYAFDRKWRFVMWSLEQQERRLGALREMFFGESLSLP